MRPIQSPPETPVRLSVGDVALSLDLNAGARAVSWTVAGRELLHRRGADPVEHGMYPMVPWAGRIRGNRVAWAGEEHALPVTYGPWALHGTVLAQRASSAESSQHPDEARLLARFDDHAGWPWPMSVEVEWHLTPGRVMTRIVVHALDGPFPCVVGWHPWFRRSLDGGGDARWSLPAIYRLVRGADHLPTGDAVPFSAADGPFDDAFAVPEGTASISWPDVLTIAISSQSSWFVVFDELPDCLCIEPQTGPPDGLMSGADRPAPYGDPEIVTPDRPLAVTTTWSLIRPEA